MKRGEDSDNLGTETLHEGITDLLRLDRYLELDNTAVFSCVSKTKRRKGIAHFSCFGSFSQTKRRKDDDSLGDEKALLSLPAAAAVTATATASFSTFRCVVPGVLHVFAPWRRQQRRAFLLRCVPVVISVFAPCRGRRRCC